MAGKKTGRNNTNAQSGKSRTTEIPAYSRGNEYWNTEKYKESVRTAHTDTTALRRTRDRSEGDGPYFFDNTAAALRERRRVNFAKKREELRADVKKNRHRITAIGRFLSLLLIAGVIIGAGLLTYKSVFVVKNVEITGDTSYSEEELVKASGLDEKPNLYSFSASDAALSVRFYCPRVSAVSFERKIPNKVEMTVSEEKAVYYTEICGDIYGISDTLRVLDKLSYEQTAGLIKLRLQTVSRAVSGDSIRLYSDRAENFLKSVIGYLNSSALKQKLTVIDLRNDFNIVMIAEDKYKLVFGSQDDFEIKLRLATVTLEDDVFKSGSKALINLEDTTKTSVIIDNQLDFGD